MTGEIPERIAEDIDALGPASAETVVITKARLQHLRDVERLAFLFMDGLLDEAGLRRALKNRVGSNERLVAPCRTLS